MVLLRYHSMPHTKIFQFLKATPRKRVRYVIDTSLKKKMSLTLV